YGRSVKPETRTFYEAAVVRAVERVGRSLDDALDLDGLAREAALSVFHFQRVFRGLVGETPIELHRRLRMERAAERLCRTRAGVTEIAFDAGYETHEAFTRAFGQRYGMSPSAFRERGADVASACHGGPPTELAARCGLHCRDGRVDLGTLTFTTGGIAMDVTIETLPARRLATVRHLGPYPQIAEAFHRLGTIAAAGGLYAHVDPAMLALYHDDPETTPRGELRSDAALVVRDDVELPSGLSEVTLPAGRYAKASHRGAYSGLGDAWARLMGEWLPRSGFRVGGGPSYEVYVSDPRTTATEDLVTDLYVPLADASSFERERV
ncbi:MAG: GyrI-like domain-containing protein, partial [Myxococcales bacterium]